MDISVWLITKRINSDKSIFPMVKIRNKYHYRVTDKSIERLRRFLINKKFMIRPIEGGYAGWDGEL